MKNSLNRSDMLKSKIAIVELFRQKKGFIVYPVRVNWAVREGEKKTQLIFSVSKRNFKRAVDRNRIKRMLREAYRLQQRDFLNELKKRDIVLSLFVGYVGKDIVSYKEIEEKIKLSLNRLLKELKKNEIY